MFDKMKLQGKIIEKAWCDEKFKEALTANPKQAIKDAFGLDIDDDITITVCEETDNHFYLVIPAKPSIPCEKGIMW